eukprot:TRINITY_DN69401_c0_g1_i1.p1 TRINITY_DN69401_c0_g1~~TRINITY_DN69401_c0_g1_i1.p1  ORF type:complete len:448 (-),score=71.88 TRINITY_DN69401_c0_g1_i1:27-1370(-)
MPPQHRYFTRWAWRRVAIGLSVVTPIAAATGGIKMLNAYLVHNPWEVEPDEDELPVQQVEEKEWKLTGPFAVLRKWQADNEKRENKWREKWERPPELNSAAEDAVLVYYDPLGLREKYPDLIPDWVVDKQVPLPGTSSVPDWSRFLTLPKSPQEAVDNLKQMHTDLKEMRTAMRDAKFVSFEDWTRWGFDPDEYPGEKESVSHEKRQVADPPGTWVTAIARMIHRRLNPEVYEVPVDMKYLEEKRPEHQRLPTLIIGSDLGICSVASNARGGVYSTFKRPGLDVFLDRLKDHYEIIIWSAGLPFEKVQDLLARIDPERRAIADTLSRDTPLDLDTLGRQQERIVWLEPTFTIGRVPEEYRQYVLPLKPWAFVGPDYNADRELFNYIPFLEHLATHPYYDLRRPIREMKRYSEQVDMPVSLAYLEKKRLLAESNKSFFTKTLERFRGT